MQRHTVVGQLLAEPGDILGVAREAVERFAHHDIHSAVLHIGQELLEACSFPAIARLFGFEIGRDRPATKIVDQLHARRSLIYARRCRLHRSGMATVDRDARGSLVGHWPIVSSSWQRRCAMVGECRGGQNGGGPPLPVGRAAGQAAPRQEHFPRQGTPASHRLMMCLDSTCRLPAPRRHRRRGT